MGIVGIRSKVIRGGAVGAFPCPYCERREHVALGVLSYAHALFIPLVPVARQALTECVFCRHTVTAKSHSANADRAVRDLVFPARKVAPTFAAAALIAVLTCVVAGRAILTGAPAHTYADSQTQR